MGEATRVVCVPAVFFVGVIGVGLFGVGVFFDFFELDHGREEYAVL